MEPLNDFPAIVRAVCNVVAVDALPLMLPTIGLENVFVPAIVSLPVRLTFVANALVRADVSSEMAVVRADVSAEIAAVRAVVSALTADVTNAVVAICVPFVPAGAVGAVGVPVSPGLARGALASNEVVTVDAKFASSPSAVANSCSVFKRAGAVPERLSKALFTNSVVAICVVFVPLVAVGAVGTPLKAGE